jgi:hypothetical protein
MKAVITKSQFDRIKNFINETREIKKQDVLDEKKKLSKKQLDTFDVDNDGDIEADDLKDLRSMKKVDKSLDEKKYSDKASSFIGKEISHLMHDKGYPHDRAVAAAINVAKEKGMKVGKKQMDEDDDCGCDGSGDDTRYMFFSNLEQMMRQARMLLQMDDDMLEDLINNGHDWAADHIAEAKNNMDQVFDFIMGEMHGEGEDESWHNEKEMVYEGLDNVYVQYHSDRRDEEPFMMHGEKWQFVNAIYPDGKRDIGVYKFGEDRVYSYDWFRRNIVGDKSMGDLNEGMQLKKKVQTSKELKHHLDENIPLCESEFRSGSPKHIELLKEVKELYNKGLISLNETDEFIVNEFDPKPVKIKGIGEVYLGLILEEYESDEQLLSEAVYQGRKVQLGKAFLTPDGPKKRSVYVRNDKGNVVKVNFGDPNMRIKKNIPARRKSFRARHNCANPGPRFKSRYWSCRFW